MHIKLTSGTVLELLEGESVLQAFKRQGVYLVASCGGKGICGKCRVRLMEGEWKIRSTGKLAPQDIESGISLACQTFPQTEVIIDIPKESMLVIGDKIALSKSGDLLELLNSYKVKISPLVKTILLNIPPPTITDNISDLERLQRSLEEENLSGMRFPHVFVSSISDILRSADWKITLGYNYSNDIVYIKPVQKNKRCGIAIDIGTTTIVVYLVELAKGKLIDVGSTYNSQIKYGDDVINRIVYATESGGLQELRESVITDINNLLEVLRERQGLQREDIESAAIAGNTTMTHIFWGLNPAYIREEPYVPTVNIFPQWRSEFSKLK